MLGISVDVITYNHKKYIRRCLESILSQRTDFDFEILVHDDASTDGTREIIEEYAKKYPDIIKPFFETENQYSRGVRRIGYTYNITRAKGKYIASCEGDDFWNDTNKLQYQFDFLEKHHDYSAHFHAAQVVDCNDTWTGKYLGNIGVNEVMTIENSLLKFYPTASKLYRRECLSDVPKFYYIGDAGDFPTQILILLFGNAYYEGKVMSCYRTGVVGSSNDRFKKWTLERRLRHFDERIQLLGEFDRYTNGKYSNSTIKYITFLKNEKVKMYTSITDKIHEYQSVRLSEGYALCTRIEKTKMWLSDFFPNYSKIVSYKNSLLGRVRGLQDR